MSLFNIFEKCQLVINRRKELDPLFYQEVDAKERELIGIKFPKGKVVHPT